MNFPRPIAGLVIRYSYLWKREADAGREEGIKHRPCAIVLVVKAEADRETVVVLPITHTPPADATEAIEIPIITKSRLGLDSNRSWIVLSESNVFTWPGPDLRREPGNDPSSIAFGVLPPRFLAYVRRRYLELHEANRASFVLRTE